MIARTVNGDVPVDTLGVTLPHEHLVITRGRALEVMPDIRHDSLEEAVAELRIATEAGVRTVVDAMPCDAGRDILLLAAISAASGIHVIAVTGIHHPRHYAAGHWSRRLDIDRIAQLLVDDIQIGIDRWDYSLPVVERTPHRAGLLKVAGTGPEIPADNDRLLRAVAAAHLATGVSVLVHCEQGLGAIALIERLMSYGVEPHRIAVAHVDKRTDRGYHGAIAETGAFLAYDQPHRWPADEPNWTAELIEFLVAHDWGGRVLLSMDAARRSWWRSLGGAPGLGFIHSEFASRLGERGIDPISRDEIFIENPARFLGFARANRINA